MYFYSCLNLSLCPQGFLDRSPVFFGFYTPGSQKLECLSTPLLYLAGICSILLFSLILEVRRSGFQLVLQKDMLLFKGKPLTFKPLWTTTERQSATSTPGCSANVTAWAWPTRSSVAGTSPFRTPTLLPSSKASPETISRSKKKFIWWQRCNFNVLSVTSKQKSHKFQGQLEVQEVLLVVEQQKVCCALRLRHQKIRQFHNTEALKERLKVKASIGSWLYS